MKTKYEIQCPISCPNCFGILNEEYPQIPAIDEMLGPKIKVKCQNKWCKWDGYIYQ